MIGDPLTGLTPPYFMPVPSRCNVCVQLFGGISTKRVGRAVVGGDFLTIKLFLSLI